MAGSWRIATSKRTVTLAVKLFEVLVMVIALIGLATNQLYVTIGCVFLMGTHSAFFGPSKYGLLPELLRTRKYVGGMASSSSRPFSQ